jgi:hypothetical protein
MVVETLRKLVTVVAHTKRGLQGGGGGGWVIHGSFDWSVFFFLCLTVLLQMFFVVKLHQN